MIIKSVKSSVIPIGAALIVSLSGFTQKREPDAVNNYTFEQYRENAEKRKAEIKTKQINISLKEKSIICSAFTYGRHIYVPIRNAAEIMDKSLEYDTAKGIVIIKDGNKDNVLSNSIIIDKDTVEAYFNEIPVHYGSIELADTSKYKNTDVEYEFYTGPDGFNIEGYIFVPLEVLTDNFGYLRYYDGDKNITIFEPSGKIMAADGEIYFNYLDEGGVKKYPINSTPVDDELLKEAEMTTWSRLSEPKFVESCEAFTFDYNGKTYIGVDTVIRDSFMTDNTESYGNTFVYEIA